jgi:urease accessory protein UreE
MLIERAIRNLAIEDLEPAAAQGELDLLDLNWGECALRAWRKTTRGGRAMRALLARGVTLEHADVIVEQNADHAVIAINIVPCDVLVTNALSPHDAAIATFELGNLHAPTQIVPASNGSVIIVTLPDAPNEATLRGLGISYTTDRRRFNPRRLSALPQLSDDFRIIYSRADEPDRP